MGKRKTIVCIETGEQFNGTEDAANALGLLLIATLLLFIPACKRPAHIAKRDGNFYFVDDEYNPFVRHAPVKTTGAVFRFFANGYRREHGTEPKLTGNRKLSENDILSGMGAVSTKIDS